MKITIIINEEFKFVLLPWTERREFQAWATASGAAQSVAPIWCAHVGVMRASNSLLFGSLKWLSEKTVSLY